MNLVRITCLLLASILIVQPPLFAQKSSSNRVKKSTRPAGPLTEARYVEILAKLIRTQNQYRTKFKVTNTNPDYNDTVEGKASATKFSNAMKTYRERLFAEYGVSESEFQKYSEKLDAEASTPQGQARRQAIMERAAKKAASLSSGKKK